MLLLVVLITTSYGNWIYLEEDYMSYKIIGDSCTDLLKEMKTDERIFLVPLSIQIDNDTIVDDETFDQKDFLKKMAASPNSPKSSCPAPGDYMRYFGGEEDIYVVTLSSSLSGSHNSAELAKKLYLEENPHKNIEVFDSRSASVGQLLLALKIQELVAAGKTFAEVVSITTAFRESMQTKFVLESLEALRKNGRLSNLQAIIASALNIKPVMGATPEGTIFKIDQARGTNKALKLLAELIKKDAVDVSNRTLAISHCNNYERALFVKEEILKLVAFREVVITEMAGISTLYASDGGIIVCY